MRIGILGSGLMGSKLGTIFARAGHDVIFSYSRSRQKLEHLAKDAGERAHVGTPADATQDADAVLLAVHWTHVDDVLAQVGTLAGKVLLTCSLPMSKDDTHMVIGHTASGAETLAAKVRGAHVVSAFSTVPSEVLFPVFERRGRDYPRTWSIAETIREQRAQPLVSFAMSVSIRWTMGPLSTARYIEPFSLLSAQLAYDGSGRPTLAYRFERFTNHSR